MKYESKFNFNDKVWYIVIDREKETVICKFCNGKGRITLNGITRSCPECHGQKQYKWKDMKWLIGSLLTIGSVSFNHKNGCDIEEEYMCFETGVGSGTVYRANDLFSSREEAQQECNKRNKDHTNE